MNRNILTSIISLSILGVSSSALSEETLEWCNELSTATGTLRHSVVTNPSNGSENPIYWIELSEPNKINAGCDMPSMNAKNIQLVVNQDEVSGRENQKLTVTGMLLPNGAPIDIKDAVIVIRNTPLKFH